MRIKPIKYQLLAGLGVFLGLNILFGIMSHPVYAGAERYNSHPQDVAWYGPNAHLEAREARFKIAGSRSTSDYRVEVVDACANSTAGVKGMTATYNGVTKNSLNGGDCNGNDFVFNNVPANRILRLEKVNGQGHAPFYVRVEHPSPSEDFPDMYITQLATNNRTNPGWNGDDEYAAIAMWGGAGLRQSFHPTCSHRTNQTTTYYKWEDADDGTGDNSNKNASLTVYYYDKLGSNQKTDTWTEQQVGGQGKRGSVPIILLPTTWRVDVVWSGVDGGNAIQMVAPYEYNPDIGDCQIPPRGEIGAVGCTSIKGWAYDPNRPNRTVMYRLLANGTTVLQTGQRANTNDYNGSSSHPDGHGYNAQNLTALATAFGNGSAAVTLTLQGYDIREDGSEDTSTWRTLKTESRTKNCMVAACSNSNTAGCPSFILDVRCDGVLLKNMDDPHDGGYGLQVFAAFFHRNVDGSGNETWPQVGGGAYSDWDHHVDDVGPEHFIPWPWWAEDGNNEGWGMWIGAYDVVNGSGGDADPRWYYSAEAEGACYQASCSLDIVENVPGGPGDAVRAGQNYNVDVTFHNPAANVPVSAYHHADRRNGGSWVLAGTATTPNNDLTDDLAGNQLTATDGDGTINFQHDFFGSASDRVPRGGNATSRMTFTADNNLTDHYIAVYPDYWQRLKIGNNCDTRAYTYRPYNISPTAERPTFIADAESPDEIRYKTFTEQSEAGSDPTYGVPYTANDIPSDVSTRLIYYNQGNYDGPDLHNYSQGNVGLESSAGRREFPEPLGSGVYFDTVPGRGFRAGDSWKPGDKVCSTITISRATGWTSNRNDYVNNAGATSNQECGDIHNRPFVRFYGNDVFGGGQYGSPGGSGGISAYLKDASQGAGAGVEFAAYALDSISGFASSSLRSASAPIPPNGLSFANTGAGSPGNFMSSRQVVNYYDETIKTDVQNNPPTPTPPGSVNIAGLGNGQTRYQPPSTLRLSASGNFPSNTRHAIYVEGDVVIQNNIAYATDGAGGWSNVSRIPHFALIVKGNIFIANNVSRLDGLYIAQPNSSNNGGRIYTCTQSSGALFSGTDLYANCNNKLEVNGAFVSLDTEFLRTHKTLSDIPFTPGSAAFDIGWTYAGGNTGRANCAEMYEDSDPIWGGGNTYRDNFLCWNGNLDIRLLHGGTTPPGGYAPSDIPGHTCESLNNPNEDPSHTWGDNYVCAPTSLNMQLQMLWNQSSNPSNGARSCVNISEPGDGAWGTNRHYLCFRTSNPPVFAKETFGSDSAAESFRLTPDFYLGQPAFRSKGSQTNGKFDYYTTLPPIL